MSNVKIFDLIILCLSLPTAFSVLFYCISNYIKRRDPRYLAISSLVIYLNSVHVITFLSLFIYGKIYNFGNNDNLVSLWNTILRSSGFLLIPVFIHLLLPYAWSKRILIFFAFVFLGFLALTFTGWMPRLPGVTIGIHSSLMSVGAYAAGYAFFSFPRIPSEVLRKSKDAKIIYAILSVFLTLTPFLFVGDFTLIPLRFMPAYIYFFRFLAFLTNAGILVMLLTKSEWIPYENLSNYLQTRSAQLYRTDNVPDELDFQERKLSSREAEVAELLLAEYSYKEIAEKLCIAPATAKSHVLSVYKKLEVNNKKELRRSLNN